MTITFLGTGTSHGVPMIACSCPVCSSTNKKNKRLRSSILIEDDQGQSLLIDASKDFREQALRHGITSLEHVLITHLHADHVYGIDELRVYNHIHGNPIKLYLKKDQHENIQKIFPHIYQPQKQIGGGITAVKNIIITPGTTFRLYNFTITPLLLYHGILPILGYRINNIAYLTDCSRIPAETYHHLQNLELLVLDALRLKPHETHFSLDEAVEEAKKIKAHATYFIHMSHNLEHEKISSVLPSGIHLSYDGLKISL